MARLPYPELASLPPAAAAAVDMFPVRLNVMRAACHAPTLLPPFMSMAKALWGELLLAPRRRELLVLLVAQHTGCTYEAAQHTPAALAAGLSDAELRRLAADGGDGWPDPAEAQLLQAGRELLDGCTLAADTVQRLREHVSDREIVEVVLLIGYYRMVAGLLNALEVEIDAAGDQLLTAASG
jgi:4-carboxymuconolactone decarboxylase